MSSLGGSSSAGTARAAGDRLHGLVDRQRGLRQPDDLLRVAHHDVGRRRSGPSTRWMCSGASPVGADDLLVALVADEQDVVVVGGEPPRLLVHLGDQRAGRVDRLEAARAGLLVHPGATPCAEKTTVAPSGTSSFSSTKIAPRVLQRLDHVLVVHDLLAHVDRRRRRAPAPSRRSAPPGRRPRSSRAGRRAGHASGRRLEVHGRPSVRSRPLQPASASPSVHATARRSRGDTPGPGTPGEPEDRRSGSAGSAASGSTARWPRSPGGPGQRTVFLTLRDPSPTCPSRVTCTGACSTGRPPACARAPGSSCTPSPVLRRRAARCRCAPTRSARSASASCWPGWSSSGSCSPPRACSPPTASGRCRSCRGGIGLISGRASAAERDVAGERPAPLARGPVPGRARSRCRGRPRSPR